MTSPIGLLFLLIFALRTAKSDEISFMSNWWTAKSSDNGNPLPPAAFYLGMIDGGGFENGSLTLDNDPVNLKVYDLSLNTTTNTKTLFELALQIYLKDVSGLMNNATSMDAQGIKAFVGMDDDSCEAVAALAIAVETPILTYVCDGDLGEGNSANNFTVQLARNSIARYRALVGLLEYMKWTTVSVLGNGMNPTSESYTALLNTLKDNQITISASSYVQQNVDQLNSGSERFISALMDIYPQSRIIVAEIEAGENIAYFLIALTRLRFLETGQYYVILLADDSTYNAFGRYWAFFQDMAAAYIIPKIEIVNVMRSTLVFSDLDTADIASYPKIGDLVERMKRIVSNTSKTSAPCPPLCDFNVQASDFAIFNGTVLDEFDINTVNAYHAGVVLATAMRGAETMMTGAELTASIRNTTFTGLMDYPGTFDKYGVLRKVYYLWTLEALPPLKSAVPISDFMTIRGTIKPVGRDAWQVTMDPADEWNMPGNLSEWPIAVPRCGFNNEFCLQPLAIFTNTEMILLIASGVAALVMLIIIAVIIRWILYERRLESCYWLIDRAQVVLLEHSFAQSIGKSHLKSAISFHSTGGLQDLEQRTAQGTLQFFEQNLREERRQTTKPKKKKAAFKAEDDDRWHEIVDWKLGKFDGHLVTVRRIDKQTLMLTREMKQELDNIMHINCENLNKMYGLVNNRSHIFTVHAFAPRMSLNDLLRNVSLRLDRMFKVSFVEDIMRGLSYLHNKSKIGYHANLKSTNCVVDAYWRIRLSNFSMIRLREGEPIAKADDLLWTAPELIRHGNNKIEIPASELAKADMYSFSIVLYEVFGRQGPWGDDMLDSKEIIDQLKYPRDSDATRPDLAVIGKAPSQIVEAIKCCWAEDPHERPSIKKVRGKLKVLSKGMRSNIADNIMALLDRYRFNLEDVIKERTEELSDEKRRNEQLLLQMLPRSVADNLKDGKRVDAEYFDAVSIYFSDIVGFTSLSSKSAPLQIVDMLNDLYTQFDTIIDTFDCYKVETIGDAYMFVSGLPLLNGNLHAGEVAGAALELLARIQLFKVKHYPDEKLRLRIGIHTGPVVTGVVGVRMPRYCLFGDTVITASAMESSGEPMKIQVSEPTYRILDQLGGFEMLERGEIQLKNKMNMRSYWLHSYDLKVRFERLALESNPHPHLKKFVAK